MTAIPKSTGSQAPIQKRAPRTLFDMVVRSLAGDDHVMHMAFTQTRARDAHKLRIFLQVLDCSAAEITHAGSKAANELVNHRFERSAVGNAPFDALRNKFSKAVLAGTLALHYALSTQIRACHILGALEVTLAGALAHGGQ